MQVRNIHTSMLTVFGLFCLLPEHTSSLGTFIFLFLYLLIIIISPVKIIMLSEIGMNN